MIRLTNFKSFKNEQLIGPFLNLTSIVGPNGSTFLLNLYLKVGNQT